MSKKKQPEDTSNSLTTFSQSLQSIEEAYNSLHLNPNEAILKTWIDKVGYKMLVAAAHRAYDSGDIKTFTTCFKLIAEENRQDTTFVNGGIVINFPMTNTEVAKAIDPFTLPQPHEQTLPTQGLVHRKDDIQSIVPVPPSDEDIASMNLD